MIASKLIAFLSLLHLGSSKYTPVVQPAEINQLISSNVNSTSEIILEYHVPKNDSEKNVTSALRLFVERNPAEEIGNAETPLLVVVRHRQGVDSWQVIIHPKFKFIKQDFFLTNFSFRSHWRSKPTMTETG